MECREAKELLHADCDGELGDAERQRLTGHVRKCRGCTAYEKMMKALKSRVRAAAAPVDLPLAEAVLERVTGVSGGGGYRGFFAKGFFRPGVFQAVAAAAVLACAVFFGISLVKPAPTMASIVVMRHLMRQEGRLVLDTHANCCKDLQEWFESHSGRPVHIPDISYPRIRVDGGTLYRHGTGNSIFLAAYSLEGQPVTVCVCTGPNITFGSGKVFTAGQRTGMIETGQGYTLISWRSGQIVNVLITPFDEAKSKEIFASIK